MLAPIDSQRQKRQTEKEMDAQHPEWTGMKLSEVVRRGRADLNGCSNHGTYDADEIVNCNISDVLPK